MKRLIMLLLVVVGLTLIAMPVRAQDDGSDLNLPADVLVLMPDSDSIRQVFRFSADNATLIPLTNAPVDVESFDVWQADVAYIAGNSLYLNDEAVQDLHRPQSLYSLVHFSPTGDELSYADETGLYILNRETGENERLIERVDFLNPNNPNGVVDGRYYLGASFIEGTSKLLVTVGLWEARTSAIFDRETNVMTALDVGWNDGAAEFRLFDRVIPLRDGRVLFHNSDGRGCSPCGFWVAPSFDDIRDYEQVVDRDSLDVFGTSADFPIPYIHDLVEVSLGVIRILISTFNPTENTNTTIVADVDLSTANVTPIATVDPQAELYQPIFSADGRLLVGLTGVDFSAAALVGWISVMDAETGEMRVLSDLPMVAAPLTWAD